MNNDEVIDLRANGAGFQADVAAMRASLEGSLAQGAERAGRSIEGSLLRAARNGQIGFDNFRSNALSAMDAVAASAIKVGLSALIGSGGGSGGGGLGGGGGGGSIASILLSLVGGSPGRATGGPVAPGHAYTVGERGPELFVPTASGRIEPAATAGAPRDVRVSITVNAAAGTAPPALQQSSRQIARAVRAALQTD